MTWWAGNGCLCPQKSYSWCVFQGFYNSYAAAQPWLGVCKLELVAQRPLCLQSCTLLASHAHFKALGPWGHLWEPPEDAKVCLEGSINPSQLWGGTYLA